jgi:hypothetical protein
LKYSDGVRAKWDDSMTIYITIDNTYKEKTAGLCGNYNGKSEGLTYNINSYIYDIVKVIFVIFDRY